MRILLGLWLLQAFSAGSVWLALSGATRGEIFVLIGLALGAGLLVALWIWTALRDQRRLGEARQNERTASKTAALHADLARQRAADTAKLRAVTQKAAARPQSRLLTAGLLSGGALGVCVALILTQVLTLGLLAVAFVGGAGAGYMLRGRLARRAAFGDAPRSVAIPAQAVPTPGLTAGRGRILLPFLSSKAKAEAA